MGTKHKFEENLLKTSIANEFEEAKKEWIIIDNDIREEKDGLCICQHKLKNVTYLYNVKNSNMIIVGTICLKKFNMDKNEKMNNNLYTEFLKYKCRNLLNNDYEKIEDINEYLKKIKEEFKEYLNKKINEYKENLNEFNVLDKIQLMQSMLFYIVKLRDEDEEDFLKDIYENLNDDMEKIALLTKDYVLPKLKEEVLNSCENFEKIIERSKGKIDVKKLKKIYEAERERLYYKYFNYFNIEDDVFKWYKWFEHNMHLCEEKIKFYEMYKEGLKLKNDLKKMIENKEQNIDTFKDFLKKEKDFNYILEICGIKEKNCWYISRDIKRLLQEYIKQNNIDLKEFIQIRNEIS